MPPIRQRNSAGLALSHIDTISGDLEAMSTGLGRAHDSAAAADSAAGGQRIGMVRSEHP
jgi:hypothetical protein